MSVECQVFSDIRQRHPEAAICVGVEEPEIVVGVVGMEDVCVLRVVPEAEERIDASIAVLAAVLLLGILK
jgi:hypothetical protein